MKRVFGLYLAHRSPQKNADAQKNDKRAAAMWTAFLGSMKDLTKVTRREWESFIELRRSGALDPRGNAVEDEEERKPVRDRSIEADLWALRSVINWAVTWQDDEGRYLMRENPVRGFDVPKEKNPRRPVATEDRYVKTRAKADHVQMEVITLVNGKRRRRKVRSYLSEVLDIVNGTGRRLSAVLSLKWEDLRLDVGRHGAVVWPEDTDKMGKEQPCTIDQQSRRAIDRILSERPGIGSAWLFPSPRKPSQAVDKDLASKWLLEAEEMAGLPKLRGSLWHAYRRKWATERKHLPTADVARAGGWSRDTRSLQTAYQHADVDTMDRVITDRRIVRQVLA